MPPVQIPLLAVDIGNSRIKIGEFTQVAAATRLPEPSRTLELTGREWNDDALQCWLAATRSERCHWQIGSVCRKSAARLAAWVKEHRPKDVLRELRASDLPLMVALCAPERVGIDRLFAATAANRLRQADRPAIIVDLGSAITVDLVTASGEFAGGSILPGIGMSARALHEQTDLLPEVPMSQFASPPPALGTSTETAIESGLFWGAIGAIRELIGRLAGDADPAPDVFLAGGAATASVVELLGGGAQAVPNLVLSGIAIASATDPP